MISLTVRLRGVKLWCLPYVVPISREPPSSCNDAVAIEVCQAVDYFLEIAGRNLCAAPVDVAHAIGPVKYGLRQSLSAERGHRAMGAGLSNSIGRNLQTLFRVGVTSAISDQQLLEQFLAPRGQRGRRRVRGAGRRHGPMVWWVCRRTLADPDDAEDAFQVTFLVLARNARSIPRRQLLEIGFTASQSGWPGK